MLRNPAVGTADLPEAMRDGPPMDPYTATLEIGASDRDRTSHKISKTLYELLCDLEDLQDRDELLCDLAELVRGFSLRQAAHAARGRKDTRGAQKRASD